MKKKTVTPPRCYEAPAVRTAPLWVEKQFCATNPGVDVNAGEFEEDLWS